MRNAIIGTVAALAVMFAAPRSAKACGGGANGGNYTGLAVLAVSAMAVAAVDSGLALWDGGSALAGHRPGKGYAAFEAAWTIPQVLLGGAATIAALQNPYARNGATAAGIYTLTMGLMTAHAIVILAGDDAPPADDSEARQMPYDPKPKLGLGATVVPVGQFTKPAPGLVAHF